MTFLTAGLGLFIAFFLLLAALGVLSTIVAYLVGSLAPAQKDRCSKCIAGWTRWRGLRNRLLLTPACIMIAILSALAIMSMREEHQVRNNIVGASQLIVRTGGNCHRDTEGERILFKTEDSGAIKKLAEQISLGLSIPGGQCMCCGNMTFDFYRDQELRYSFSFHHGQSIRIKDSGFGDKELSSASQQNLKFWLDQNGITQALAEFNRQEEAKREQLMKADEKPGN